MKLGIFDCVLMTIVPVLAFAGTIVATVQNRFEAATILAVNAIAFSLIAAFCWCTRDRNYGKRMK